MADPRLLLIVTLAFVMEAALGFGSSVIVATLGALLGPLDAVMPAFITANLCLSAWVLGTSHAHVNRALLLREVVPLAALGMLVGFTLGRAADLPVARVAFGAGVALLAGGELVRALRPPVEARALSRVASVSALIAGGVVHGVFGAGGPLIVYVAGRRGMDKAEFRATLSALWLLLNAALVVRWAASGVWSFRTLRDALWLAPALLVGVALGGALFKRLPPRGFRVTAAAVMGVAGMSLALRTLGALG